MFAPRSIVVALGLGFVLLASAPSAEPAKKPSAEADKNQAVERQSLGRSFEKLRKEKKLKIAYLGGPITAGKGIAKPWHTQTTEWFQRRFPDAKITEVAAAAEGGSEYGAFRLRKDIVEKDPDLVFIEFAVDDADVGEQRVLRSFEGIVRQFWTTNPWAEIVIVDTASKTTGASYTRNEVPKAIGYHRAVAKHYGIPEIDVAGALTESIRAGKESWESLTTDGTHPNDAGTAVYFRTIEAFLAAHVDVPAAEPLVSLPAPLSKDPFSGAYLAKGTGLYAPGWRKVTMPADSLPTHIEADVIGAEVVHTFTGSTVGLLLVIGPDGGDIEWSIDDGPPQRLSAWSDQTGSGPRPKFVILADDLKPGGEHSLSIRVHQEKQPKSTGTKIRIAAIMMHCDC